MTVLRPVTAFVTATAAGLAELIVGREESADRAPEEHAEEQDGPHSAQAAQASTIDRARFALSFAFDELLPDLGPWLILGVALAGAVTALMPADFIGETIGSGLPAYLTMLAISLPLYVCATMSTPLAAALILKGLSPGAALVFLIAGPATNVATVTMVWGVFGRRTTAVYLGSIVFCAVLMGYVTDAIYAGFDISTRIAAFGTANEIIPMWAQWSSAAILGVLLIRSLWTGTPGAAVRRFFAFVTPSEPHDPDCCESTARGKDCV